MLASWAEDIKGNGGKKKRPFKVLIGKEFYGKQPNHYTQVTDISKV